MDDDGNPLTDIGLGSGFRASCSHGMSQVRVNFEESWWLANWHAPTCDDFEIEATTAGKNFKFLSFVMQNFSLSVFNIIGRDSGI